jgi:uncharacterized protein YkwD
LASIYFNLAYKQLKTGLHHGMHRKLVFSNINHNYQFRKVMMRFVLLLLTLTVVIHHPVSSGVVLATFQQQALVQHNYQRQLHCTGAMILNSTLNTIAQNYSDYLAANNLFQHSGTSGLGENLWAMWSSIVITFVNGKR